MDYEKAYKDAIERAKYLIHEEGLTENTYPHREACEYIFPQLAESEDEKIRKKLVEYITDWKSGTLRWNSSKEFCESALAYLEKQKEQKSTDDGTRAKIISRATSEKQVVLISESDGNAEIGWDTRSLEDAKNLLEYGISFISKQLGVKPAEKPINWTELTWKDINELEGIINNVHYEFRNGIGQESFGKEVLEKFREYKGDEYLDEIAQKHAENDGKELLYVCNKSYKIGYRDGKRDAEQKLAEWKQENCKDLSELECAMLHIGESFFGKDAGLNPNDTALVKEQAKILIDLVESNHLEWSEEDEENFKWFDKFFRAESILIDGKDIPQDKYLWFKSLRPQPKQKWSEEDESNLSTAICIIKNDFGEDCQTVKWLKSLCNRFVWKPSEEQMKALHQNAQLGDLKTRATLSSLYNDLKAL